MKKLSKGALAMVIAGSVTFSVTNALLADHPIKRLAKATALNNSIIPKIAEKIDQPKKSVKDLKQTTEVIDVKIAPTHKNLQETPKNRNKNEMVIVAKHQNIKKFTKRTVSNPAKVNPTPTRIQSATKIAAASIKVSKPMTTTPVTVADNTATSTPIATTTATNHGKIISQNVKEKTHSHQNKKETNGKKM